MKAPTDNETWIIEKGDDVIQKKVRVGISALTRWERLIYCLWVADYGMRNAGDLDTSADLYAQFQSDAVEVARELGLPATLAAFDMARSELQARYFTLFEVICNEIRNAE